MKLSRKQRREAFEEKKLLEGSVVIDPIEFVKAKMASLEFTPEQIAAARENPGMLRCGTKADFDFAARYRQELLEARHVSCTSSSGLGKGA